LLSVALLIILGATAIAFTLAVFAAGGEDAPGPGAWVLIPVPGMLGALIVGCVVGVRWYLLTVHWSRTEARTLLLSCLGLGVACTVAIPILSLITSYAAAVLMNAIGL